MKFSHILALSAMVSLLNGTPAAAQSPAAYPDDTQPGEAWTWGNKAGDTTNLNNEVLFFCPVSLRCSENLSGGVYMEDFSLILDDREYHVTDFKQTNAVHVTGASQGVKLSPDTASPRVADHEAGWGMRRVWQSKAAGVTIVCQDELRDHSHYVKRHYTLTADREVTLTQFTPLHLKGTGFCPHAELSGATLAHEEQHMFFTAESPAAETVVTENGACIRIPCSQKLHQGQSVSFTVAVGVYPAGQLPRAYQAYAAREGAEE